MRKVLIITVMIGVMVGGFLYFSFNIKYRLKCVYLQWQKNIKMREFELALLAKYDIDTNINFQELIDINVTQYIVINDMDNYVHDTSWLSENLKYGNFVSLCLKTLNVNSGTCYEIGIVKVEKFHVVDIFQSYLRPIKPLSKAMIKEIPRELLDNLNEAPSFPELWKRCEIFFESRVLVGAEAFIRRFVYCCNKFDIPIAPMIHPFGTGSEPLPKKDIAYSDDKPALEYALEWAANRLKEYIP